MSEIEILRKELARLEARIKVLEEEAAARDRDLREGYLSMVRGAEKRLKIGKYAAIGEMIGEIVDPTYKAKV
jgi:hypothetical protein